MRKWSKQGFLNPADSNDDGWYKFSIRPKIGKNSIGLGIQYIISDCSNKIYLEFEPDYVHMTENSLVKDVDDAQRALKTVAIRRKKIRDFAAAVAKSAEMIEQNLDSFESLVQDALDRTLSGE